MTEDFGWPVFWGVLILCVAWPMFHAYLVHSVTVRLCDQVDQGIPPEKRLPVFLHEIANDGYVWNRYAEEMGQNGQYRLRYTTFDNSPDGRSVHWNSAFAWYLRLIGELRRSVTGEPLRHAIFNASIWANPILLAIALLTFTPLAAWRFGPLCGSVIAIGMVSVPTFYEGFLPAYPDHHGVISFQLLGMMFGIACAGVGWVKPQAGSDVAEASAIQKARHGMTFSAICAGCGLWWSAISTAMVLITLGVSVLITTLCFCFRKPGDPVFQSQLWKWWAMCGAGTSLAMWLLEYFPNHMSMRLEVNHPLYSLAFLGGGWFLATVGEWSANLGSNAASQKPFPWRDGILSLVACTVLPVAILIGGTSVYIPKDPFMGGLWENIYELQSVFKLIGAVGMKPQAAFGWYPLFILVSLGLVLMGSSWRWAVWPIAVPFFAAYQYAEALGREGRERLGIQEQKLFLVDVLPVTLLLAVLVVAGVAHGLSNRAPQRRDKTILVFLTLPIVFLIALQCYQSRWGLLVGPIYIVLAGVVISQIWKLVSRDFTSQVVSIALLLIACGSFVISPFANLFANVWIQHKSEKITPTGGQALQILHRQMAKAILDDANGEPVVLLSSPNSSCILACIGGFQTVGTLYWENVVGLKAAAAALNAQSDEEALDRLRKLGVTHVSFMGWENFIEPYFKILHQKPGAGVSFENSFGKHVLFDLVFPEWVRPLFFPPNMFTQALRERVILLRVDPGQKDSERKLGLARFMLHMGGKPDVALPMLEKIVGSDPKNTSLRTDYADALAQLGQFDKAVNELILSSTDADASVREAYVSNLTPVLKKAKQYSPLAKLVRAMAGRKDASPGLLLHSAWILATSPDEASRDGVFALELLDRLDGSASANGEVLLTRAAAHAAKGNFEAALAVLDESPLQNVGSADQKKIAAMLRESFQQRKPFVNP